MGNYFTEQTKGILDNILHGVILTDKRGHILFWNTANEEIFGYSKQEIISRPINVLFDDKSDLPLKELLQKCSLSEPVKGRWHGIHKQGSSIWLEVRAKVVKDSEGRPQHCVITLVNIDKLKNTETRLNHTQAVAEAIFSTSTDAIITADSNGKILSVNKAASRMFGYESDELLGENLKMLMPYHYQINQNEHTDSNLFNGERKVTDKGKETQGLKKDHTIFPIELAVSEIVCNGDQMFAGIIRDLSMRRKLEHRIIEIGNEERRRIGRDLHDGLGQMLTGIRMLAENLARKLHANAVPGADEVKEIAEMINEADGVARSIARDMVQVEIEKKGLQFAVEELCKKTERMTGVTCNLENGSGVEIENHSRALHLYRIVQEAINNAVKHGNAKNIDVRLSENDRHFSVVVQDDGVGFTNLPEDHNGKGIQIMKHRARMMGGNLDLVRTDLNKTMVKCIVPLSYEQFT
ncbi:PAS domain-containing sensor histidine kinase [Rhodohalobacter sp. 8-1]|uniref:PAS domain-containing sensor histidine kinase n=1 Tax=Rhodohalobacter sp. 8-1 TaxID=3131972 RepID=UPI0030ED1C28